MHDLTHINILRKALRSKRLSLSEQTIQSSSQAIIKKLIQLSSFQQARHIGIYWPVFGEVDLRPLLSRTSSNFYLPVITEDQTLTFRLCDESTSLIKNRFGINEPTENAVTVFAQALDIVCAPLVAFTKEGLRLGMGGGFYDKTFAFCLNEKSNKKPCTLIGIGYDWQQVEKLEVQAWDVPMDLIITDLNTYGPFKKNFSA
ncbi:MAG: 5-formyltetrahydrofolate cyclo-ligase [Pseudomonadota bacterium]